MCAVVGTSVITRHCGLSAFLSMIRWKAFVSVQFVKRDRAPLWQLTLGDDLVRGPSPRRWLPDRPSHLQSKRLVQTFGCSGFVGQGFCRIGQSFL